MYFPVFISFSPQKSIKIGQKGLKRHKCLTTTGFTNAGKLRSETPVNHKRSVSRLRIFSLFQALQVTSLFRWRLDLRMVT